MLWGGEDVPCAQILLMSLGGLDTETNCHISEKIQELLAKHGRYYQLYTLQYHKEQLEG